MAVLVNYKHVAVYSVDVIKFKDINKVVRKQKKYPLWTAANSQGEPNVVLTCLFCSLVI